MSAPLWTPLELATSLGRPSEVMERPATGVSIDTRTLEPGDLFVAIKGDTHDGHDHVAHALAAGASAALVSAERAAGPPGPLFVAEDSLKGLERLAAAARRRSLAKILAITGSVGKTSAKEMARTALGAIAPTHASPASFNNHWGVPLTLARLPATADFGVFEIGMNHAGEITPLVALVCPHVALVTTIAPAHIEYLGTLEAIADAKAEIFSGVEPGGAAVLNRDAPQFARLAQAARGLDVLSFGASAGGASRLIGCELVADGSRIEAEILGERVRFALGAPGRHMAENAVGVLTALKALGAPLSACAEALQGFAPAKGRGERLALQAPDGPFTLIDESYNANPISMRAALALLGGVRPGPGGRRIAVIGDMLELGAQGRDLHASLAPDLAASGVDLLFTAGPLSRALYDAAPAAMRASHAERADALRPALASAIRAGDVVMVKGSNGSRMGPLVQALREVFAPAAPAAER